jgi:hypothetical protein
MIRDVYEVMFPLDGSMGLEFGQSTDAADLPVVTATPEGSSLPRLGHFVFSVNGQILSLEPEPYHPIPLFPVFFNFVGQILNVFSFSFYFYFLFRHF